MADYVLKFKTCNLIFYLSLNSNLNLNLNFNLNSKCNQFQAELTYYNEI